MPSPELAKQTSAFSIFATNSRIPLSCGTGERRRRVHHAMPCGTAVRPRHDRRMAVRFSARPIAALRVICFPYAGGRVTSFRPWAVALPGWIDVWGVQLPGHDGRLLEPPISSVRAIVDAVVPALLAELDRPYALFGHSMGALVAFEVARALQARGAPPAAHLLVSGRRAPHLPAHEADIHDLDNEAFVAEMGHRYGGIPAELLRHPDVMDLLLPVLRADMTAIETHVHTPGEPLICPISVFGGDTDPYASPAELSRVARAHPPADHDAVVRGRALLLRRTAGARRIARGGPVHAASAVSRVGADDSASNVIDSRARGLHPGPSESFSRLS